MEIKLSDFIRLTEKITTLRMNQETLIEQIRQINTLSQQRRDKIAGLITQMKLIKEEIKEFKKTQLSQEELIKGLNNKLIEIKT